ncbi:hypothetical protein BH24DEI2_BH24DEI2_02250 [soil metagenome]
MDIVFGTTTATIDRSDAFKLQTMAASVLNNRPTFRSVKAKVGTLHGDIYTECVRAHGNAERLTVKAGDTCVHLWGEDRAALAQLISDTQRF